MTWTATQPDLRNMTTRDRFAHLPAYIKTLLDKANSLKLGPTRVWIFGSRARGDARENSDFDLAFEMENDKHWSQFVNDIHEDPPSLHKYDLINFRNIDTPLRDSVLKDGIIIYESR